MSPFDSNNVMIGGGDLNSRFGNIKTLPPFHYRENPGVGVNRETTQNHPKSPKISATTHNHPKSPTTTHNQPTHMSMANYHERTVRIKRMRSRNCRVSSKIRVLDFLSEMSSISVSKRH